MSFFDDENQSERQRRYALLTGQQVGSIKPTKRREALESEMVELSAFRVMEMTSVDVEITAPDPEMVASELVAQPPIDAEDSGLHPLQSGS